MTDSARPSIRRHLFLGLTIAAILAIGVGGWAASAPLSGAVIATGTIVVDSHVKPVQHADGGIVSELPVRNGARVQAGDILVRLEDTQVRASLAIVENRIDELQARGARLAAERDRAEVIAFPLPLNARAGTEARIRGLLHGEQSMFDARKNVRDGRKEQMRGRISQLREEIEGLKAQMSAKSREMDLIDKELEGVRSLHERGLASVIRLNALDREAAQLEGEHGALAAAIAKARGQIAETELQIVQIDDDLQSEVAQEIRDVQAQIGEFAERRIAAEDELRRLDIASPQAGIVHDLAVHAAGAVVAAGEPLLTIVPDTDDLVIEVRVTPSDIDQLAIGQQAVLRFSAFNQRTTPEIAGTVSRIGADLTEDVQTGLQFYLVRVAASEAEIARLGRVTLVPGMPVEAFIQTESRTVLSYLVKPLADQIERAFREE